VIRRIVGLRKKFPGKRIMISKMDVKDAFRQVQVEPRGGAKFGYCVGDLLVIDFRLQFGWRNSPGWWDLLASALEFSHCHTDPKSTVNIAGGGEEDQFFARMYVDDSILVEPQWFEDGRRLLLATNSLVSDHIRLLGKREIDEPPILSAKKLTGWHTTQVVVGWKIDTEAMTIALPEGKLVKLKGWLEEWPESKSVARVQEVWVLLGRLFHMSYVIRPGKCFLWIAKGGEQVEQREGAREANREIRIGPEFKEDLNWWRWVVEHGLAEEGENLCSPFLGFVSRLPGMTWYSDACFSAVGGYNVETGKWWRYEFPEHVKKEIKRSVIRGERGSISINVLELLGMVMNAWVLVMKVKGRAKTKGDLVLLRGDNYSAVHWFRKCGGAKDKRAGGLMRIMGVLEIAGEWPFAAEHVAGKKNELAD
ncbi:unnamed protein product, partial [Choristocarpus tenellus]